MSIKVRTDWTQLTVQQSYSGRWFLAEEELRGETEDNFIVALGPFRNREDAEAYLGKRIQVQTTP